MIRSNVLMWCIRAAFLAALLVPAVAQNWQALPDQPPIPKENPMNPAKIELGKMLYFDPRMSSTGTVSCNSCHNLAEGGDDSRPTSFGVHGQLGGRNAPTVWNAAFLSAQFWDGRAPTLRNIEHTAPYFHNGAVKSLDEAVRVMASTQLNRSVLPCDTPRAPVRARCARRCRARLQFPSGSGP